MNNLDKMILTDCDGVLLNWEYAFDVWMNDKGHSLITQRKYETYDRYGISYERAKELIKFFNESASMGFIPPLRDAMQYVRKLHEEYGYTLGVITSLSTNPYAVKLRERNLKKLFGSAIAFVQCLETGSDKDEALAPYKDSGMMWIEDKVENAEVGYDLGLQSILIEHGHNMNHGNPDIPIVKGWREIYEMLEDK
jgi:hypothetical protein